MSVSGEGETAFVLPAGTVTLLLADLEGSVRLWEADREAMTAAVARLEGLVAGAVGRHGGVRPVEQGEGDSFVAAFSRASDALACALALQLGTREESWPGGIELRLRMALHTGEVQLRDEANYIGAAINRCARLRDTGHGGQALLSRATYDLVADRLPEGVTLEHLGAYRLRDLARPEDVYQLCHPLLPAEFPPLRSLDALPNNLPVQLTSFIGREAEMAEVRTLLAENRLLTLTGAGGCGKTRLAVQVAADLLEEYPDGVWWVDLAPIADPSLAASAVASVLSVKEVSFQPLLQTIASRLQIKRLLLVLDNCEHVVPACAELATDLLRGCPSVAILATSREPLGVEGELAWRVPSLTLPPAARPAFIESLTQFEAVRLFIDRAQRAKPNFRVTNDNAPAVAEICHRLDGIPLAIELAAARTRMLTPEEIAEGLGDRFRLLTGGARTAMPRQQTLEASVDWSYDHLGEDQQLLLRRLSVFAGGFSLDAAEAVCSGDGLPASHVFDVLSQLVDRSLVQVENAELASRYRLLETIRQYGGRKVAACGEQESLRDRHLEYFVEWAGPAEANWGPAHLLDTVDRHDFEIENLRAALDWAEAAGRIDAALRLGAVLAWLWFARRASEGRRRLEAILAMPGGDPLFRAGAEFAMAQAYWRLGDPFTGRTHAEKALVAAREADNRRLMGRALSFVGMCTLFTDTAVARPALEQAVELLPEEDDYYLPFVDFNFGVVAFMSGDWPFARRQIQEVVARARAIQDPFTMQWSLTWLGLVTVYQGDLAEAEELLREALVWAHRVGDLTTIGFAWSFLGLTKAWRGDQAAAAEAIEKGLSAGAESGSPWVEWMARSHLAYAEYGRGDYEAARASLEPVLPFLKALNEAVVGAECCSLLAEIARVQGDLETAKARAEEAMAVARTSEVTPALAVLARARIALADDEPEAADDLAHEALPLLAKIDAKALVVDALENVAAVAARQDSYREAARLLGAAQGLRDLLDYRWRSAPDQYAAAVESSKEGLDEAEWEAAWAEGAAMTLEEAVAYAARGRGERKRPSAGWASLTPTELDVARLVAQGLTNPQIAERLFVARSTVKVHLSHIFGKLGLSTRSQLAGLATRRGL